jgi:hypothetical protein
MNIDPEVENFMMIQSIRIAINLNKSLEKEEIEIVSSLMSPEELNLRELRHITPNIVLRKPKIYLIHNKTTHMKEKKFPLKAKRHIILSTNLTKYNQAGKVAVTDVETDANVDTYLGQLHSKDKAITKL